MIYVFSELVDGCNLKCTLCWNRNRTPSMEQMTLSVVEKIMKRFNGTRNVRYQWFNWGEPLLYGKFYEFSDIVDKARSVISSNFSLKLSDKHFDILKSFRTVIASISGLTEEVYGIYHHGGNFRLVMDNLERLKGFQNVKVNWIRHRYNTHQDDACREMCVENGFHFSPLYANCEVEDLVDGFKHELLKTHFRRNREACGIMPWIPISVHGEYLLCCTTHNVGTGYTIDDNISQEELMKVKMEIPICKTCREREYWRMYS